RMRPFQIWYLSMKLNAVTDRHRRVVVSSRCRKALAIWRTPWFLAVSGTMGIVSRCVVVTTDASTKGFGSGLRGERRERSLVCERGRVSYKCVRTADSSPGSTTLSAQTEWSACVSEDGQHCGLGVYKPSRRSVLPVTAPLGEPPAPVGSDSRLFPQGSSYSRSLQLRCGPVIEGRPSSSRLVFTPSGDTADLDAFRAQVDMFANRQNTCCPLWFSLRGDNLPLGIDALGHQWPDLRLYAFPPIPLLQQVLCRVADEGRELILIAPHWPNQPWAADLVNMSVQQPWELPLRRRTGQCGTPIRSGGVSEPGT